MNALGGSLQDKPSGADGTDRHADNDNGKLNSRILRLTRDQTLSTMDPTSNAFRSNCYFVLLFLSMMFGYLAFTKTGIIHSTIDCDNDFAYEVGKSILSWIVTFLYMGLSCFLISSSPPWGGDSLCRNERSFTTRPVRIMFGGGEGGDEITRRDIGVMGVNRRRVGGVLLAMMISLIIYNQKGIFL